MSATTNFGRKFCTYLQASEGWETTWAEALQKGSINIDSAKIIRSDSYHWCYMLPVVKRDSLTGIVVAQIIAKETKEDKNYSIQLNSDTYISELKFLDLSDDNSYSHSSYFSNYKRPIYYTKNLRTRTSCTGNEFAYFAYSYEYESYSTEDYCVSGTKAGLMISLDYFRSLENTFEYYIIGNFNLTLVFRCYYYHCDELSDVAYDFAMMFNNYLKEQGYMARIFPLFINYGGSSGGGSSGGGSTGGGSTGGGSSGGGSTGSGGRPNLNPEPEVCNHAKCSVCGKCLNSTNGNCQKCTCQKNCTDAKCPYCKKCLNPTKPNCSKCSCTEHLHEECPWCHNCYKDDADVCKTRSATHAEDCPTCDCCPDCMGPCTEPWLGVGHANIIDAAFPGFTSAQIGYLNAGSKEADKDQSLEHSYMHGMRAPGQSKAEGLVKMRNFFIENVNCFYDTSLSEEKRFESLGMAVHMISDCYSPAHSNKTWIRNIFNWIKHIRDLRIFSNRSFNEAKQGTINVVNQIRNQVNSGNHDHGAIFDQWSTTMPAYNT